MAKGGCACNAGRPSVVYGGGVSHQFGWPLVGTLIGLICVLFGLLIWVWLNKRRNNHTTVLHLAPTSSSPPNAPQLDEVKPNKLPRYFSRDYQQVGILTSPDEAGDPMILPLYGKRMDRHDRWQYYAAGEKPQHLWRVPVYVGNRECEESVGCPEIQNGDVVNVPVYAKRVFVASMYKLDAPKYFADDV